MQREAFRKLDYILTRNTMYKACYFYEENKDKIKVWNNDFTGRSGLVIKNNELWSQINKDSMMVMIGNFFKNEINKAIQYLILICADDKVIDDFKKQLNILTSVTFCGRVFKYTIDRLNSENFSEMLKNNSIK